MQTVCQHQKGGHWTSTSKEQKKQIKDWEIDKYTHPEANLQPRRTSMTDHFCKNSQRLKVVSYFHRKTPSQMLVWAPNTSLNLI